MERGNSGLGWVLSLCPTTIMLLFSRTLVFTAVHWVATLNVGSGGAHASYYHRANEQVRLLPPHKSVMNFCLPSGLHRPCYSSYPYYAYVPCMPSLC